MRDRLLELGDRAAARDTEAAFVGTFHAFCSRLLRAHPLAAGLPPDFAILDEGLAGRLRRAAFTNALAGFLVRYPDHPYAANALYWRGECYWALGDYSSAATQFDALVARFPASGKTPDGLLKLGLAHRKLGSAGKAKVAFDRLRKEFPTSEAAKKIPPEDAS